MDKQKLISRKEAVALGLKFYFTGEPCINGHQAKRRTRVGQCMECDRIAVFNHYHKKQAEKLQGPAEEMLKRARAHLAAIRPFRARQSLSGQKATAGGKQ